MVIENTSLVGYENCLQMMIQTCHKFKQPKQALSVFNTMRKSSLQLNRATFNLLGNICFESKNASAAKGVLQHLLESTGDVDLQTISNLIRTLIEGRQFRESLQVLDFMDKHKRQPNATIYILLLKACANLKDLEFGKRVHTHIQRSGLQWTFSLQTSLLGMYTKCKYKPGISATMTG
jgi:hypothetical protein